MRQKQFLEIVTGPTLEPAALPQGRAAFHGLPEFPFYQTFNYSPYECVLV
jgi:hypothetical protein